MNDMVCVLEDDVDFAGFRAEQVNNHERIRNNGVTWSTPKRVVLQAPEKLSGNLTVSFYDDQRKIVAQANPAPLKHFITYYSNAINKMKATGTLRTKT